jgi:hypothetical protein
MKITKAERDLIVLEKGLRNVRNLLVKLVRDISPKSRHAVKDTTSKTTMKRTDYVERADVIEALKSFDIRRGDSGYNVFPPDHKLASKLWTRIKTVMANNGGDWSIQRQAFVFEEDPKPIFETLIHGKV